MASVRQASKAAAGRKDVPFTVSRNFKTGLVEQVVCGLRQAIRGGFYKPGDVIAPVRDLAVQLNHRRGGEGAGGRGACVVAAEDRQRGAVKK